MATIQSQKQPQTTMSINQPLKTDQTIGGNNYFMTNPAQGQQNSLVNTGAVAGIREETTIPTGKKVTKSTTPNITQIKNTPQSTVTDKTIGGNNYYFYNPDDQGRNNSLVNTGAVAGINQLPTIPGAGRKVSEREKINPTQPQTQKQPIQQTRQSPTQIQQDTPDMNVMEDFVEEPQEEQPMEEVEENLEPQTEEKQEPQELATIDQENKEGTIYGRASGESQQTINTNADQYSADQIIQTERQQSLNNLQVMDSYNVAISIANGYTPYGDQAMRDLQQYDPQKYQQIQEELRKIQVGEQINQIASGGKIDITGQTKTMTENINNDIESRTQKNSDSESYNSTLNLLTDKLASSQTAQSATQEMLNINKDIAEIQSKLENLPREAKNAFKGDVPQYLVDAYISNKSQELQAELNKLQSRYASASDLYKTELAQKQREAEMELKNRQLAMEQSQMQWNMYLQNAKFQADRDQQLRERSFNTEKLNYANIQNIGGEAYIKNANGQWTRLSEDIAYQSYQNDFQSKLKNYLNSFQTGNENIQCEKFSNDIVYAVTGLRMQTKTNFGGTTAQEKASYCNDREPRIGNVAVFDYGITQDNGVDYGHTAVVTGYDPNTKIVDLVEANFNGDGKITTRHVPVSDLMNSKSFQGYRNPYMNVQANSVKNSNSAVYDYVNTPMTDTYEKAYADAKDTKEREGIHNSFEGYKKLNDLVKKGAIDLICNSSDFDTLIQRINENKFLDSNGNIDFSAVGEYARNSLKNEELSLGIDALRRLIEIKLRRESGAAISMTEWNDQFTRYLPQLGQSPEEKRRRIIEMERDCVLGSLGDPKYQKLYVPLISEVSTLPNEIWDD